MVTRLLKSALNSLQIAWAKMCRRILWRHSPPRRGGVDAPSEAKAQTGWREARARHGEAPIEDRRKRLGRTDHPGTLRHPSSARRGITKINPVQLEIMKRLLNWIAKQLRSTRYAT